MSVLIVIPARYASTRYPGKPLVPLTGAGVVDRIITNLGVFDVVEGGLKVVELADGVDNDADGWTEVSSDDGGGGGEDEEDEDEDDEDDEDD